jgi:hypothetical protein
MATEFAPTAVESARLELAWKYLMPAPLSMDVTLLLTVERPVERDATLLPVVLATE